MIGVSVCGAGGGVCVGNAVTSARAWPIEGTAGGVKSWTRVSMGSVWTGAAGVDASDVEVFASGLFLRHGNWLKEVLARARGLEEEAGGT